MIDGMIHLDEMALTFFFSPQHVETTHRQPVFCLYSCLYSSWGLYPKILGEFLAWVETPGLLNRAGGLEICSKGVDGPQ